MVVLFLNTKNIIQVCFCANERSGRTTWHCPCVLHREHWFGNVCQDPESRQCARLDAGGAAVRIGTVFVTNVKGFHENDG